MNDRLSESRLLYSSIKNLEVIDGTPQPMGPMSLTLRGLIYVSLYGAIEYSATQGVQAFINHLCGLNIQTKHLEQSLFTIALDSQLSSARAGSEKKNGKHDEIYFHTSSLRLYALYLTPFLEATYTMSIRKQS
ncbi:hypothetical protein [Pseudomonas sp. R4-39-08]|uniref:hypothetical protein n=1 Tax=Pseudomonas sp. R4-39-08 TaxID=1173288 RepID=UPI000F567307|nr:hypothetical protein [Pseudomonas sp. R4-39-08]